MSTQKTSTGEAIRLITEEPIIKVESASDDLTITIQTEETRRRIRLAVNGKEVEIVYNNNDRITPERIQEELAKHSYLLELARNLRSEQQALTEQAVDREMNLQRALQFVPPQLQAIVIKIAKVIASIFFLLQFKSPFIQEPINKGLKEDLMELVVLRRGITEINKQKATYEGLQAKRHDQQLAKLVGIMEEIIYTLRDAEQSMTNGLRAELRASKIIE